MELATSVQLLCLPRSGWRTCYKARWWFWRVSEVERDPWVGEQLRGFASQYGYSLSAQAFICTKLGVPVVPGGGASSSSKNMERCRYAHFPVTQSMPVSVSWRCVAISPCQLHYMDGAIRCTRARVGAASMVSPKLG